MGGRVRGRARLPALSTAGRIGRDRLERAFDARGADPCARLRAVGPALRTPALREVVVADHSEVLRLLAKRNIDIGNHRTRVVCRLHNLLMELAPGGIAKELNASDAIAFLERIETANPAGAARRDQATELLADVQRLDEQLKA